jgi:hypothetical protein
MAETEKGSGAVPGGSEAAPILAHNYDPAAVGDHLANAVVRLVLHSFHRGVGFMDHVRHVERVLTPFLRRAYEAGKEGR